MTHFTSSDAIHDDAFKKKTNIKQQHNSIVLDFAVTTFNMNVADYWPMAREYSIWNATIASLQFGTADLDPVTLGMATQEVYFTFFYSTSTHTLHQQSDEILFGCFVIALNAAFD